MKITNSKNITYIFNKENHTISVAQEGKTWTYSNKYRPYLQVGLKGNDEGINLYFDEAKSIKSEYFSTGVSEGMRTDYKYWDYNGKNIRIHLRTLIWVHKTSGRLYFELIPISEPDSAPIIETQWPATWQWERTDEKAYSLIPLSYGMMIPSNYDKEITPIGDMIFLSVYENMPWYGQVDNGSGYIAIAETPWDAGVEYYHSQFKATELMLKWYESLGKLNYRRVVRMEFFDNSDYVTLCKSFRQYVKERGDFVTLKQKRELVPRFDDLVGSPIIHDCIYFNVKPEAYIYKKDRPEDNYRFKTFDRRADQIAELHKKGLKKAYFHLDGWGVDGYDREHPDILPPCQAAGGEKSMKRLIEKCRESDILFALHDQYRDYYFDARTHDKNNAVMDYKGEIPKECTWNGGDQNYLCETLAPYYVERNYDMLKEMGIEPDGVYLDVFSCIPQDECTNPEHTMTRKECVEFRRKCMALLAARGMIISSETMVDGFVPYLILCHYFPEFAHEPDTGIRVPLFNLCYHDCAIVPWTIHEGDEVGVVESRYLYALLNGGPSYLDIDADKEQMERVNFVCELQKKLVFCEMVSHEFLTEDYTRQRATYSDGTVVTVDFNDNTFIIEERYKI